MFGVEPLARIVRQDARIEVKVPATQGRKAYSYFREGGEGEKKSSGMGKKLALIGGGLALAGLGAAALAMSRKKTETGGGSTPVSEPKKAETNNTARNAAIATGIAGLGAAAKVAASKKNESDIEQEKKPESEPSASTEKEDIPEKKVSVTKESAGAIALLPPAKEKAARPRKENEVISNGVIVVGGKSTSPQEEEKDKEKASGDPFQGIKFGKTDLSEAINKYSKKILEMSLEGKDPRLDQTFDAFLDEIDDSDIPNKAKYKARLALASEKDSLERQIELIQAKSSGLGFDPNDKQEATKFIDKALSSTPKLRKANNESDWTPSMSRDDAEAWAKDSVIQDSFYHGTSGEASRSISQEGFRLDKFKTGKIFGESVYLTENQGVAAEFADKKNPEVLETKINVKKVYNIRNADKGIGLMSEFYEKEASKNGEAFERDFKAQLEEEIINRAVRYRAELASRGGNDKGKGLKERVEKDPVGTIAGITRQASFIRGNMISSRDIYAQAFSRTLEKQGYDAMRIEGLNYLMVFNPKNIAVIKSK